MIYLIQANIFIKFFVEVITFQQNFAKYLLFYFSK